MKISNLFKDEKNLKFTIEDVDVYFMNALRRLILVEVPTLAIEEVTFFENDSILYDEVVAHRLGLIPLKTDLRTFSTPENCKCSGKGCPKCQVLFTLIKEGPCTIYSRDLKPSDPKVIVSDPDIPLTKLTEDQKIKLEAKAVLGCGKDHAKWQSGVVTYRYYPSVKINKNGKTAVDAAKRCPVDVFDISSESSVKVKNEENCNLCMACADASTSDEIEVNDVKNKFIFKVESHGDLKPEIIVEHAAKILQKRVKEISSLID